MRPLGENFVHGKSWVDLTSFLWMPISKSGRPTNSSHGCPGVSDMWRPHGCSGLTFMRACLGCERLRCCPNQSTQIISSSMTTKYYHFLIPCCIINQLKIIFNHLNINLVNFLKIIMRPPCGNFVHGQSWANLTSYVWVPLSDSGRPTNPS